MHTLARLYPIKRASVCIVPKSRMYYSTKFPFYVCCSVCVTYGNGFGVIMPHWKQYRISPACNWLLANVLCLCIARIDVYVHSISCLTVMPQRLWMSLCSHTGSQAILLDGQFWYWEALDLCALTYKLGIHIVDQCTMRCVSSQHWMSDRYGASSITAVDAFVALHVIRPEPPIALPNIFLYCM